MRIGFVVQIALLCVPFGVFVPSLVYAQDVSLAPTDGANGKVVIEIGSLPVRGEILDWLSGQIAEFAKTHPSIEVKVLGTDKTRLEKPIDELPSLAENIIGIGSAAGGEVAYLVGRGDLVPFEQFLPDSELALEDFYPNLFDSVTYHGKTWGIPICAVEGSLICNWPLFEAAGISEPPRTWKDFGDALKRVTKDTNGDGSIDQVGLTIEQTALMWMFLSMSLQHGVSVVTNEGFKVDSPEAGAAYEFLRELYASGAMAAKTTTVTPASRILHFAKIESILANEEARKSNRAVPLPSDGNPQIFSGKRTYLGIRKSTREKEAASWALVKWLMRKNAPLPTELGVVPPRIDTVSRPDFEAWTEQYCAGIGTMIEACGYTVDTAPHLGRKMTGTEVFGGILFDGIIKNKPASVVLPLAAEQANAVVKPFVESNRGAYNLYR